MRTAHRILMAWVAFLLLLQGALGVFVFFLGTSEEPRMKMSQWIMDSGTHLLFIGGLLVVLAVLLIAVTIRLDRREYYQVKMGFFGPATEVDLDVVRSLVGRYWQIHFPSVSAPIDALLRSDQTLELFVELPSTSAEVMQKIEGDLGRQLARHLGYRRPFFITVT